MEGTCLQFCPRSEVLQRRGNLGSGEDGSEKYPLVKSYTRSAAGSEILPECVRPLSVLCAVVKHLLSSVLSRPGLSLDDGYIGDRLRAARADACVQRLSCPEWAVSLVHQTRYHLLVSYLLSGIVVGDQAQMNFEREGEALGDAVSCIMETLQGEKAGYCVGGDGESPNLFSIGLEVLGYSLILALPQPLAVRGVLFQASLLLPAATPQAQEHWRAVLAPCLAYQSGRWGEFLRLTDSLLLPSTSPCPHPAIFFSRCALHRHVPAARLALLCAFNDSVPKQRPFPVCDLARLLRFRAGSRALNFNHSTSVPSLSGTSHLENSSESPPAATNECEPAWFRVSRLLIQLRLQLQTPVSVCRDEKEPSPCTAQRLIVLRDSWLQGSVESRDEAATLEVVFDKTKPPANSARSTSHDDIAQLRLSLVSMPSREDSFLHIPGVNTAAPFSGIILRIS